MIQEIPGNISRFPDNVIFYDSGCGLCGRSVEFLKKIDKKNNFTFVPLNSPMASDFLRSSASALLNIDSVIYLNKNRIYLKSDAVIEILSNLSGPLSPLRIFKFLPVSFRDGIYDLIARNRNKWFPRTDSCSV